MSDIWFGQRPPKPKEVVLGQEFSSSVSFGGVSHGATWTVGRDGPTPFTVEMHVGGIVEHVNRVELLNHPNWIYVGSGKPGAKLDELKRLLSSAQYQDRHGSFTVRPGINGIIMHTDRAGTPGLTDVNEIVGGLLDGSIGVVSQDGNAHNRPAPRPLPNPPANVRLG